VFAESTQPGSLRHPSRVPRKLRIEYPGAVYHVINRGNYRRDVFEAHGTLHSFVTALEEAVRRHGWRLYAYVVMRNHFHLVLETPEPNLSQGMHWLLSTAAIRFNRYRSERGHLFQGRFQALPIEDDRRIGLVCDYVHLNPVRAGVVTAEGVSAFPGSSLRRFARGERFDGLDPRGVLRAQNGSDDPDGWQAYVDHLIELTGNLALQRELGFNGFSSGWAIGSADWRRELAKEYAMAQLSPGLTGTESHVLREARWKSVLEDHLKEIGHSQLEAHQQRKTVAWKVQAGLEVRRRCGASIGWLARELHLGSPGTVRSLFCKLRG
jgi:putative transposase